MGPWGGSDPFERLIKLIVTDAKLCVVKLHLATHVPDTDCAQLKKSYRNLQGFAEVLYIRVNHSYGP